MLFQWDKIVTVFKCIFEVTVPQLSVNSYLTRTKIPVCNFGYTEPYIYIIE